MRGGGDQVMASMKLQWITLKPSHWNTQAEEIRAGDSLKFLPLVASIGYYFCCGFIALLKKSGRGLKF